MTAPVPPRKRLSPTDYRWLKEQGYNDDELRADGFDPPEEEGVMGTLKSAGLGAAEGATFGFADEIAGGLGSLFTGRTYADVRDSAREVFKSAQAANPKTYAAGNIAGAVLSPVGNKLTAGAKAGSLGASVVRGAGAGAAGGALYGLGTGEGSVGDQAAHTLAGAGIGAVAGGVVPVVGRAASRLKSSATDIASRIRGAVTAPTAGPTGQVVSAANGVQDVSDWSLQQYARAIRKGGVTPDALEQTVTAATPDDPRLLLNVSGKKAKAMADAAVRRADDGGALLTDRLEEQMAGAPGRVVDALRRTTGSPLVNGQSRLQQLTDDAAEQAKPYYERLRGMVLADPDLQVLAQRPSIDAALSKARKNLRDAGWKEPAARGEWEPAVESLAPTAARPASAVATPKPGMTERGLWQTAKTSSGGLRKVETVDTDGLLDELQRRTLLDRKYHKETRKYGPNSAVTRRNQEAIHRIYDVLEKRDGFPTEQLDDVLRQRAQVRAEKEGVEMLRLDDWERIVLQPPNTPKVPQGAAQPLAANEGASVVTEKQRALFFDELDTAKKLLDAEIDDLAEQAAAGPKRSVAVSELRAKTEARDALVEYIDRVTDGKYAEARGVAEPLIRGREAFRAGQSYGPATSRDVLSRANASRTAEERALYAEGVAHRIRDDVDRVRDGSDAVVRFVGSPLEREKLGLVFDSPELQAMLQGERGLARDAAQVLRGSQTAQRLQEGHAFELPTSSGGVIASGLNALKRRGQFLTEGRAGDFSRIAADRITDPRVRQVIAELRRQSAQYGALTRAGGRAGAGVATTNRP